MRAELPTGTVTSLFTDIEGSTRLLRELGDRYAEVLAEQRRALRDAWLLHEGVEVDTQGDAFFVAFARATVAVAAAAGAQQALAPGPVRVRIRPAHGRTGPRRRGVRGVRRAPGSADRGRGARGAGAPVAGDSGSCRLDVRDLGLHRLKDLSAPEAANSSAAACCAPLLAACVATCSSSAAIAASGSVVQSARCRARCSGSETTSARRRCSCRRRSWDADP